MEPCRFFCFLLLFALQVNGDSIRVASLNVNNYALMDRMVEGKYKPNYPKPEAEKAALRKTILENNPDILVLQEIGDAAQLLELQRDLRNSGLNLPYSALLANSPDKERHIAVLSRIAPHNLVLHNNIAYTIKGNPYVSRRGMLELQFITKENIWSLFTVHLKNRLSDDDKDPLSERQRTGEAQALRNRIEKRTLPKRPYLLCGDFNDTPDSRTLKRFLQKGSKFLSYLIECTDAYGLTWTHCNPNSETLSRFDYFLISPEMQGQAKVVKGNIASLCEGSDHRLIYIDMEL